MNRTACRAARATNASLPSKLLALILSVALATAFTPLYALADDNAADAGGSQAESVGADSNGAASDNSDHAEDALPANGESDLADEVDSSAESPQGASDTADVPSGVAESDSNGDGAQASGSSEAAVQSASSDPNANSPADSAIASISLADAVVKLHDENWRLELSYGEEDNANEVLKAKLAEMGIDDASVRVSSVEFANKQDAAEMGISAASDDTNGDVTYFFMDPDDISGFANFIQWRQVTPTFEISRGDESVSFTPSRSTSIPWNESKVEQMLAEDAKTSLAIGFAMGDSAESVTQDMTLPYKLEGKSWSEVSWSSSDEDVVAIEGYSWEDRTGSVTRASEDAQVTLMATVGVVLSGGPEVKVQVPYDITVKADSAAIDAEKALLQQKVDEAFSADALTYSSDGSAADAAGLTGDVQLPRPSALGIDGADYWVTYGASNDSIAVNGYRGNVYRPLPGATGSSVELTLTVTSKANSEISASKTIELAVAPLEASDIEAEVALMEEAKAGYAAALANGQDASNVTGDLSTFQKAYRDADGSIAWARDYASANAAGDGIVAVDLEPDDDMGAVPGHWFKSSDASVIAHDTLLFSQPEYNTQVTVTSVLSSEKYARYAQRYAEDPTWGSVFASLAHQEVSAAFTVRGTTGEDDPEAGTEDPESFTVSARITGVSEHGADEEFSAQTWVPLTEITVDAKDGTVAWDVFADVLDDAGYTYALEGYYCPYSITSPDGRTLAASSSKPWSYWSFIVNGEYASVGADQYAVQEGDIIELVYVDGSGSALPEGGVEIIPDADHPDLSVDWAGFADGGSGSVVTDEALPSEGVSQKWTQSLLTEDERAQNASLVSSDALIIDGKIYIVASSAIYETTPPYNAVKSLARLSVIDPSTGEVERQVPLARSLDSVCRPVYSDGIIVIPLAEGYLQAVSASTLETIWVLPGIEGAQSISSLTVDDGYVYVSTADEFGADYVASAGTVRRVNLYTGALSGTVHSDASGYYWAGGVVMGDWYVVADDSGTVSAYVRDLSAEASSLALSAGVRSTLVVHGGYLYAASKDGVLHKLSLSDEGVLSEVGSVSFAASSTSTPTIVGNTAFVGGASEEFTGVLAVIDVDSMTVEHAVTGYADAAGTTQALPGDVKSAPLVSTQDGSTYAYFTCNNLPGGLYVYKLGEDHATLLHLPDEDLQNYSMSSAFAGSDGKLYYVNDSGTLFALEAGADLPSSGGDQGDADDNGNAGNGNGGAGDSGGHENAGGNEGADGSQSGAGFTPVSPAGSVAPGRTPIVSGSALVSSMTRGAEARADAASNGGSADESVAKAASTGFLDGSSASDGSSDSSYASDSSASEGAPVWAFVGLGAGVVCLIVAGSWLFATRRSSGRGM